MDRYARVSALTAGRVKLFGLPHSPIGRPTLRARLQELHFGGTVPRFEDRVPRAAWCVCTVEGTLVQ